MAATPPPGRKKIKRSNLLSKRSSTGFLGFPTRHCQKGVFTFGLVGPRLYIIVLYLFIIFPHISMYFQICPSSPDVSVVFPWLEDAWPIISWRPCRIRTCPPPKKNDGLQCLSSCFIIFSTKSAIGYGAMPRYRGNMSERKVSPFLSSWGLEFRFGLTRWERSGTILRLKTQETAIVGVWSYNINTYICG